MADHTPAEIVADVLEERGRLYWEEVNKIANGAYDQYKNDPGGSKSVNQFAIDACNSMGEEAFEDSFDAYVVLRHSNYFSKRRHGEINIRRESGIPWTELAIEAFIYDCVNEAVGLQCKALSKK